MKRQMKTLLPFLLVAAVLLAFPLLEALWERHNPFFGAWHGEKIVYYNDSDYEKSLREGFRRWESVGLPLRFEETTNREEADLIVSSNTKSLKDTCKNCTGWATIGYTPFRQAEIRLLPPSNPMENRVQDFLMMPTIIHEIGHVLGLQHNDLPCSIMNSGDRACRSLARPRISRDGTTMLCGPWGRDLDNLRELYPEVKKDFSGWCYDKNATLVFYSKYNRRIINELGTFRDNLPIAGNLERDVSFQAEQVPSPRYHFLRRAARPQSSLYRGQRDFRQKHREK